MNKSEYRRKYYLENKTKEKELNKQWKKDNQAKVEASNWKSHLKTKFNLSIEDYNKLLAKQNYACAICCSPETLHIDHCHKTNLIRGILCRACNIGLGHFKDDPSLLEAAVNYLKKGS